MIKVLDKAFALLETAVLASPDPVRSGGTAEKLGLNPATCSRILKELAEAGYLVKLPHGGGYAAGPRAFALAHRTVYKPEVTAAADALLKEAAPRSAGAYIYCERAGTERYILSSRNGCPRLGIRLDELSCRDLTRTATGLILTAFAPEADRKAILKAYAGERSLLDGPEKKAEETFRKIRAEGFFTKDDCGGIQALAAFPVFRGTVFEGALGAAFYSGDFKGREKIRKIEAVRRAAAELTRVLSQSAPLC